MSDRKFRSGTRKDYNIMENGVDGPLEESSVEDNNEEKNA